MTEHMPQVALPDGTKVPALGQGSWNLGEAGKSSAAEAKVLREGIDLGLTLIDTAEMYANGGAERVVGEAIAGRREQVFLVSKVLPQNASAAGIRRSCEASLKRLRTDRIDLYLLHWAGPHPLAETVEAFEALREAGRIRYWGVSNFDADAMVRVMDLKAGSRCATDQVLYHPGERGIEFDLLPWARKRKMPVMAYSPLGQGGRVLRSPALAAVAKRHDASTAQVALAWCLRDGNTIAIPKAADPGHLKANAEAVRLRLTDADLQEVDAAHPPPSGPQPLAML